MNIKNINKMDIPDLASMAERRIVDTINLLDGILNEAKDPQNKDAKDNRDAIADLCDIITRAYDNAKSSLNELQQG